MFTILRLLVPFVFILVPSINALSKDQIVFNSNTANDNDALKIRQE
jgi:hypothetical protein